MTTIRLIIIHYIFMSCTLYNIILEISESQTHAVVNFPFIFIISLMMSIYFSGKMYLISLQNKQLYLAWIFCTFISRFSTPCVRVHSKIFSIFQTKYISLFSIHISVCYTRIQFFPCRCIQHTETCRRYVIATCFKTKDVHLVGKFKNAFNYARLIVL